MSNVIYLLWDPRNGEIRYVGKTSSFTKRINAHKRGGIKRSHCRSWEQSLVALGLCCEWAIVENGLTDEEANEKERWWIGYGKDCGWPLTNHTEGGDGAKGYRLSDLAREHIAMGARNRFRNPAEHEKCSSTLRITLATPAMRVQLSEKGKKRYEDPIERLKQAARQRMRYSDPVERKKTSAATKAGIARKRLERESDSPNTILGAISPKE